MFVAIAPPALVGSARDAVHRWAVGSQQGARRNAIVASTECAQRRAERQEVEDFFAALLAPREEVAAPHAAHG
ncbi:hypothetical protein LRP67_20220 [Nocardioides sp. cx-169]|uniref:hypothetical protein n=1 Tax=Nocardioides sp. cx-169 TaxID=2899080 RepID=UPI001E32E547|nr:hypothetical protein [Nocardioides sp. cx-169]MCD4536426.1 hypothetical protein [Nocardioides sp. cx-169]